MLGSADLKKGSNGNKRIDGKIHQKLNKNQKPIVNKYREGKMKKNFEKRVKRN